MTYKTMIIGAATIASLAACSTGDDETPAGDISITIQQALTGQTTTAGTFALSGAISDDGQTTEDLTFGAPLTSPQVPVTFRRVLTGKKGTLTLAGAATLTWTSQTAGTLAGNWKVESATGIYATGQGTFTGTANFGVTPPTASLTYTGVINR
jgi:hypothetical protein